MVSAGQEPASGPHRSAPPREAPAAASKTDSEQVVTGYLPGSYLGLGVRELDSDRAKELNLNGEYGVEITSLVADGPAARSGLERGDVVVSYNGQRVEGVEQFVRMVQETPAGRHVKLQVNRRGSTQTMEITTARRSLFRPPLRMPDVRVPLFRMPDIPRALLTWRSGMLGIEAERVDSQLAAFFGVKEGVLVRAVNSGTPAGKAGLRAGDVIVRIGSTPVGTPREITLAVSAMPAPREFPVALVRERKQMTVTVSMDEAAEAGSAAGRSNHVRHIVSRWGDDWSFGL